MKAVNEEISMNLYTFEHFSVFFSPSSSHQSSLIETVDFPLGRCPDFFPDVFHYLYLQTLTQSLFLNLNVSFTAVNQLR